MRTSWSVYSKSYKYLEYLRIALVGISFRNLCRVSLVYSNYRRLISRLKVGSRFAYYLNNRASKRQQSLGGWRGVQYHCHCGKHKVDDTIKFKEPESTFGHPNWWLLARARALNSLMFVIPVIPKGTSHATKAGTSAVRKL